MICFTQKIAKEAKASPVCSTGHSDPGLVTYYVTNEKTRHGFTAHRSSQSEGGCLEAAAGGGDYSATAFWNGECAFRWRGEMDLESQYFLTYGLKLGYS